MSRRRCCCGNCGDDCDCFALTFSGIVDDDCVECECLNRTYYLKFVDALFEDDTCHWWMAGRPSWDQWASDYYCRVDNGAGIHLIYNHTTRVVSVGWYFGSVSFSQVRWQYTLPGTDTVNCEDGDLDVTLGSGELIENVTTICDYSNASVQIEYVPAHECPPLPSACTGCDCNTEPADQLKVVFQGLNDTIDWQGNPICTGCGALNGRELIIDRVPKPTNAAMMGWIGSCVYTAQLNLGLANGSGVDCANDITLTVVISYDPGGVFGGAPATVITLETTNFIKARIVADPLLDCSNFSEVGNVTSWQWHCNYSNATVTISNA